MNIDNSLLKPCPFCGRSDKVEIEDDLSMEIRLVRVTCHRCFVEVKAMWIKEAIKRWNRRPPNTDMNPVRTTAQ